MIFILFIISILTVTTLWSRSLINLQIVNEEYEIKHFITKLNYFKSKAISSNRSIALYLLIILISFGLSKKRQQI